MMKHFYGFGWICKGTHAPGHLTWKQLCETLSASSN